MEPRKIIWMRHIVAVFARINCPPLKGCQYAIQCDSSDDARAVKSPHWPPGWKLDGPVITQLETKLGKTIDVTQARRFVDLIVKDVELGEERCPLR